MGVRTLPRELTFKFLSMNELVKESTMTTDILHMSTTTKIREAKCPVLGNTTYKR